MNPDKTPLIDRGQNPKSESYKFIEDIISQAGGAVDETANVQYHEYENKFVNGEGVTFTFAGHKFDLCFYGGTTPSQYQILCDDMRLQPQYDQFRAEQPEMTAFFDDVLSQMNKELSSSSTMEAFIKYALVISEKLGEGNRIGIDLTGVED